MDIPKSDKVKACRQWLTAGRPRNADNCVRIEYLKTKKAFKKRLHWLAREYENESLKHIMTSDEMNSTEFWKVLKRNRSCIGPRVYAVQNRSGTAVHGLDEVLEVWCEHFSSLCTPKNDPTYDSKYYIMVNKMVDKWRRCVDTDDFFVQPFHFI